MITRDNIQDVIYNISDKDKKRIKNTNKEYIILEVVATNNTYYIDVKLTNNTPKTLNNGECILYVDDVVFNGIRA